MAPPKAPAWWDWSWNPVGGCKPVSTGCKNCYAADIAALATPAVQGNDRLGTRQARLQRNVEGPASLACELALAVAMARRR